MKLDFDCIRDILFYVEDNSGYNKGVAFLHLDPFDDDEEDPAYDHPLNQKYDVDTVFYHLDYCIDAGLLHEPQVFSGGSCVVPDLTPEGHEFIANIREDTNWNKVKDTAKNAGSFSLKALTDIATKVVAACITQQLK